jgi:hypothetical protein
MGYSKIWIALTFSLLLIGCSDDPPLYMDNHGQCDKGASQEGQCERIR